VAASRHGACRRSGGSWQTPSRRSRAQSLWWRRARPLAPHAHAHTLHTLVLKHAVPRNWRRRVTVSISRRPLVVMYTHRADAAVITILLYLYTPYACIVVVQEHRMTFHRPILLYIILVYDIISDLPPCAARALPSSLNPCSTAVVSCRRAAHRRRHSSSLSSSLYIIIII